MSARASTEHTGGNAAKHGSYDPCQNRPESTRIATWNDTKRREKHETTRNGRTRVRPESAETTATGIVEHVFDRPSRSRCLASARGIARAAGRSRVARSGSGRSRVARARVARGSLGLGLGLGLGSLGLGSLGLGSLAGSLAGPSARPATTRKARQLSRALAIASSPPQSNMCSIRTGVRPAGPDWTERSQPDTPPPPFTFGQRYYSYAFGGGFHLLLCPLPPTGLPTPTSSNTRPLGVSQPNSGAPR